MTVYLDLVMLINFIVDLLLLLGTNRLSGFSPGWKRTLPAALLGSLYGGLCMLPPLRFLGNLLWRTVFLILTGCVAFGCNRSAIKRTGLFLLLSMAMGGVAVGMGRNDFGMLILSGAVVWLLCSVGFGGRIGGQEFVCLSIPTETGKLELIALKDSGNSLKDPITGESVIVVSPEAAMKLTGLTLQQICSPLETLTAGCLPGAKLIPYRAVGKPGGLLLAKRFSHVRIGSEERSAILAFAAEQIGSGEIYQALTGGAV